MLNNCGLSLVVLLNDSGQRNFSHVHERVKMVGFSFDKPWECRVKNYQSKRDKTLDNFSLIQNNAWEGLNILLNNSKEDKFAIASGDRLDTFLEHLTYNEKNQYLVKGEVFVHGDLNIYIGKVLKNEVLSKNFILSFEISNIKNLNFSFEVYNALFKNFLETFGFADVYKSLEFDIKSNWKVLDKVAEDY